MMGEREDDPADRRLGNRRYDDRQDGNRRKGDRRQPEQQGIIRDPGPTSRPTRIDINIGALLTTADGHSFAVVIRELSAKGFRLEHDDDLLVGEHVSLKVGSDDAVAAEIKWALGREAGGQFLE
jgi:hypothetical protein